MNINYCFFFLSVILTIKNSFEYVRPADNKYGAIENGSWNGLVGMVSRNVSTNLQLKTLFFWLNYKMRLRFFIN